MPGPTAPFPNLLVLSMGIELSSSSACKCRCLLLLPRTPSCCASVSLNHAGVCPGSLGVAAKPHKLLPAACAASCMHLTHPHSFPRLWKLPGHPAGVCSAASDALHSISSSTDAAAATRDPLPLSGSAPAAVSAEPEIPPAALLGCCRAATSWRCGAPHALRCGTVLAPKQPLELA